MSVTRGIATGRGHSSRWTSVFAGHRRRGADISQGVADDSDRLDRQNAIERDPLHVGTVEIEDVDTPAAAIMQRARAALLVACDGWRERRRCTAPDGSRVAHPHPECLAAQYRYELILLENGIPR